MKLTLNLKKLKGRLLTNNRVWESE